MADEATAEAENGFSPAEEDHQGQNNFFLLLLLRPYVGHALITATVCVLQREEREGSVRPSWGIIHLADTVLTDYLLLQAVSS